MSSYSATFKKLLYVGSGCHISPLHIFSDTKEFVFIDTKPRSEFDSPNSFVRGFYRQHFVSDLLMKCLDNGFSLIEDNILDESYSKKILSIPP